MSLTKPPPRPNGPRLAATFEVLEDRTAPAAGFRSNPGAVLVPPPPPPVVADTATPEPQPATPAAVTPTAVAVLSTSATRTRTVAPAQPAEPVSPPPVSPPVTTDADTTAARPTTTTKQPTPTLTPSTRGTVGTTPAVAVAPKPVSDTPSIDTRPVGTANPGAGVGNPGGGVTAPAGPVSVTVAPTADRLDVSPVTADDVFTPTPADTTSTPPVNLGAPATADGGRSVPEVGAAVVVAVPPPKVTVTAGESRPPFREEAIVPLVLAPEIDGAVSTRSAATPGAEPPADSGAVEAVPEAAAATTPSAVTLLAAVLPVNLDDLGGAVRAVLDGLDGVRAEFEWLAPDTETAVVLLGVAAGLTGYELQRRRRLPAAAWSDPFGAATV